MSGVLIKYDKGQLFNYPYSQDGNTYKTVLIIK